MGGGEVMTRTQLLRQARIQGVTQRHIQSELGLTAYRFGLLKKDVHWLTTAVILEAMRRVTERRGLLGLQTDLVHFTGEPQ